MPEYVRDYLILRPFSSAGGGQSVWTEASRDGVHYFIKRFLAPTFPLPDGPGSDRVKSQKRSRCAAFEIHHRRMWEALTPMSGAGGNLVVTRNFFRDGAHYYKLTDLVDAATPLISEIASMSAKDLLVLLVAATHSVRTLHQAGLVHGDIKPSNILLKQIAEGKYTAKLIDFDNSFPSGNPSSAEWLVGTPVYYSPEMMNYVLGNGEGRVLTCQSDIFALGLVFAQYALGRLPRTSSGHNYIAEEVQSGGSVELGPELGHSHRAVLELASEMLNKEPTRRPTIDEVYEALRTMNRASHSSGEAGVRRPDLELATSSLRGALAEGRHRRPPESKLRGSLLNLVDRKKNLDQPWTCSSCDHVNPGGSTLCEVCYSHGWKGYAPAIVKEYGWRWIRIIAEDFRSAEDLAALLVGTFREVSRIELKVERRWDRDRHNVSRLTVLVRAIPHSSSRSTLGRDSAPRDSESSRPVQCRGWLRFYNAEKSYGFIEATETLGNDVYVRPSSFTDGKIIDDGTAVTFVVMQEKRGPAAKDMQIADYAQLWNVTTPTT